uniref:Uncharacterized protein n=1 Tax=Brassica campestris TaxID=3711 RepID=A0A3P5ZDE4_BRACM|nr:unnamed protein product [Brassica rapa]
MNLAGQALSLSLSLSLSDSVRRRGAAVVVQVVSGQWTVKTKLYGRPV